MRISGRRWWAAGLVLIAGAAVLIYVVSSSRSPAYPPQASNLLLIGCENRSDVLRQHPHMSDEWKQQVIDCVHFTKH